LAWCWCRRRGCQSCALRAISRACAASILTQIWSCWNSWNPTCARSCAPATAIATPSSDLREKLRSSNGDRDSLLRKIQDSFSNGLQASDFKACLAESPSLEADELARIYLERAPRRRSREAGPRQAIFDRMRQEFESAGVWRSMRHDIKAADYTRSGDPLKIDCSYTATEIGSVKMFHALALPGDINGAKLMAFTYPRLAEGILKKDGMRAQLTAVVDDHLPPDEDSVSFALDTMAQSEISVVPIAQMAGIAMRAAREMGMS
jgi:hypothetical protein